MSWTNLDIPPELVEDSQEELRRYRRENTPLRKARKERIWRETLRRMREHTQTCPDCRAAWKDDWYERMQDERERRIEVSE